MEKDHVTTVTGVTTPLLSFPEKSNQEKNNDSVAEVSMVFPRLNSEVVTPVTLVTGERSCGDCLFIETGACQFPGDPSSVKPDLKWAIDCRGFKSKELNEGSYEQ